MVGSIQIKNPRVIQQIVEETDAHGAGRSYTEAAENLLAEAVERRKVDRAKVEPSRKPTRAASSAA